MGPRESKHLHEKAAAKIQLPEKGRESLGVVAPQQQEDAQREDQRARARRPSGPLPPGTKQPERPLPPPEPPPPTTNSSNSYHSEGSDSDSCYNSGRSISWGDEGSQQSGGPRSDSSWEDDSSWGSYAHSYGSSDSDYGATDVFGARYPTTQQSATSAHVQPSTYTIATATSRAFPGGIHLPCHHSGSKPQFSKLQNQGAHKSRRGV